MEVKHVLYKCDKQANVSYHEGLAKNFIEYILMFLEYAQIFLDLKLQGPQKKIIFHTFSTG